MKTLLVLSVALVCALAHQSIEDLADMNTDVNAAECVRGCCQPKISFTSVIQPDTGYKGSAAIIVEFGTCTSGDRSFRWLVDWGDGTESSYGSQDHLQNFHAVHQYARVPKQYRVHARYCKNPNPCPYSFRPCCANLFRVINVSYYG